jgi:hypothetical protein
MLNKEAVLMLTLIAALDYCIYDLVVELRKAQKIAATTLKYEEIERAFELERVVDAEIERVTKILQQRNDYEQH